MNEIRIFFEKTDTARFLSHLDLNRAFTRALFASHLPVWFTEGFNRHPHLVFGQPLPLGMAGERETLDMRLHEEIDGAAVVAQINEHLPNGIRVVDAAPPVYPHKDIYFARYSMRLDAKYADAFENFWTMNSIMAQKKTKRAVIDLDLKNEVKKLTLQIFDGQLTIEAVMPCSNACSIGPAVLLAAFQKQIGEEVFCYSTRKGFLLHDQTDFQ